MVRAIPFEIPFLLIFLNPFFKLRSINMRGRYKIYEITKAYKIGEMTDKKLVKKLFVQRTISDDFKDN